MRDKTTGRSRGVPEQHYRAIRLAYRARDLAQDGLSDKNPDDELMGYSLGRLLRSGVVSEDQYMAGEEWARVVYRHARIMGYSLGSPKSPTFQMVSFGLACDADPDEREIAEARERFKRCFDALMEATRIHLEAKRERRPIWRVCYAVCLENAPLHTLSDFDLGALRTGLNALARVLKKTP